MNEPDHYGLYINEMPSEREFQMKRQRNNPQNKPVGHFTGRCKNCGSNDLWDDNMAYGCNDCHAIYC